MTNTLQALRQSALICAAMWLASPAAALEPDKVLFVGDQSSYVGSYGMGDRSIAVVIDGLTYRGHFSDKSNDKSSDLEKSSVQGALLTGRWGRAFLFASSAKVIQCALDTGFPKVSGRCHDAEGRPFQLIAAPAI